MFRVLLTLKRPETAEGFQLFIYYSPNPFTAYSREWQDSSLKNLGSLLPAAPDTPPCLPLAGSVHIPVQRSSGL